MAELRTTTDMASDIERILRCGRDRILLITPFLKISDLFYDRLRDVERRRADLAFVFRENSLSVAEKEKLAELRSFEYFSKPRLHAKCYMNEDMALVGSMNLYESSEQHNREMGILVRRNEDPGLFSDIESEAESILDGSDRVNLYGAEGVDSRGGYERFDERETYTSAGTCIRCGTEISFDPDRPFCRSCYHEWAEWENYSYEESYCHRCGGRASTAMARPLCRPCFKEMA